MLKVGIFGAGHLGKIHIQQWKEILGVELVGFYDPDDEQAATAIAQGFPLSAVEICQRQFPEAMP